MAYSLSVASAVSCGCCCGRDEGRDDDELEEGVEEDSPRPSGDDVRYPVADDAEDADAGYVVEALLLSPKEKSPFALALLLLLSSVEDVVVLPNSRFCRR